MIFMGSMQVNIPLRSLDPSYRHGWPPSKKRVFHWREKASQATERVSNLNPSQNGELRRYCQVSITGRSKMGIQVFLHPWKMGIFQRFQLSFRGVYDGCWWLSLVGILGLTSESWWFSDNMTGCQGCCSCFFMQKNTILKIFRCRVVFTRHIVEKDYQNEFSKQHTHTHTNMPFFGWKDEFFIRNGWFFRWSMASLLGCGKLDSYKNSSQGIWTQPGDVFLSV